MPTNSSKHVGLGASREIVDQRFVDLGDVLASLESQLSNIPTPLAYFRWKAVIDRLLAAILLIPGLPIIGLLVLLVRLTSRGPGIYRQACVGKHGRTFMKYKIRTMARDAEAGTGAVWAQANDVRITLVGRALRKLHLDEFPQLFNVLRGEMSLVGPPPERPEFIHLLAKEIPGYLNRLVVMPGITGLAQMNLPPDSDLDSVRRKLVLDLEYIKHAGPLLDIRMFLCTSLRLLGLSGDLAMRIMGLRREVEILDGCEFSIHKAAPATLRIKTLATSVANRSSIQLCRYHSFVPNGMVIGMVAACAFPLLCIAPAWVGFLAGLVIHSSVSGIAMAIRDEEDRRTCRERTS